MTKMRKFVQRTFLCFTFLGFILKEVLTLLLEKKARFIQSKCYNVHLRLAVTGQKRQLNVPTKRYSVTPGLVLCFQC